MTKPPELHLHKLSKTPAFLHFFLNYNKTVALVCGCYLFSSDVHLRLWSYAPYHIQSLVLAQIFESFVLAWAWGSALWFWPRVLVSIPAFPRTQGLCNGMWLCLPITKTLSSLIGRVVRILCQKYENSARVTCRFCTPFVVNSVQILHTFWSRFFHFKIISGIPIMTIIATLVYVLSSN